jgi:CPA1 family monovalent cation:H+ antiporter
LETIVICVLALLAIAGAAWLGPRVRIAAPLLLVLVGIAVSLWPATPEFVIEPEWIIAGILPPLLYSAAVNMPTMEFRRDFAAISGLAVILVVLTSFAVGWLMSRFIPGIDFASGLALGAFLSPTDAVATSIVKRMGVASRVVVVLEGESLLNDASALVLLRTAIGATAASISLLHLAGDFLYSVIVACIVGGIVGHVNLRVRQHAPDPIVNTVISLTVPFLASVPADLLGASGLVAAVVAGLVTGFDGPKYLPPRYRLSDRQNWRMIEFVLEGAVFLIMGLELDWVLDEVRVDEFGVPVAFRYAAIALIAVMAVRALYVAPLVYFFGSVSRRADNIAAKLQHQIIDHVTELPFLIKSDDMAINSEERTIRRFRQSWRRRMADLDYFSTERIGWSEGGVIIWAGMRGAVTLAAAQTLPRDTDSRSILVLTAFIVASASLLIQGSTLPWLAKRLLPPRTDLDHHAAARLRLSAEMNAAATEVVRAHGLDERTPFPELASGPVPPEDLRMDGAPPNAKQIQLEMIDAQRNVLLEAREEGTYPSEVLNAAMSNLDADQVSLELKGAPAGGH